MSGSAVASLYGDYSSYNRMHASMAYPPVPSVSTSQKAGLHAYAVNGVSLANDMIHPSVGGYPGGKSHLILCSIFLKTSLGAKSHFFANILSH